ncbi:MAG: 1-deoxy-D-xylulose-5-phosphate synthase [Firmicutes bacterium]|nr:1-deoxy-D-xylulose-5-phosphate synthase [Bacillota bacterium]
MSILETINGHDDLIYLNDEQRELLCEEIRRFLVEKVSKTGGHLASNLGTVELSVALETVFDTRKDRLVFDVGHQSYVHKLLTGRRDGFDHLRQLGGMAGFPKPCESDTDSFVAGHASNSVSIGLGMARARTLQHQDYSVVALIGDGASTGGMAFEAMNDAGAGKEPLIIILNDNTMSINRNVGGLSMHLRQLRMKEKYLGMKQKVKGFLQYVPGGNRIYTQMKRSKDWLKRMLIPTTIFENMGLCYLGPVDGHDLPRLISVLETAKEMRCPVLLHVMTRKGKGYKPAEDNPAKFHGIGKFDPETGQTDGSKKPDFSSQFGQTLLSLAGQNEKICALTAAMPSGTGLRPMQAAFPNRVFDVGIAEEHAVSMAGGLAKQGMIPVVALYSTFLQRSYDMVFQDVAMLHLHVVFGVDRAGIVGEDGETHHGIYDLGFLRQVPGLQIYCPASRKELSDMLRWAVEVCTGPVALRYPRGSDRDYSDSAWDGKHMVCRHREGDDAVLITYGVMLQNVMDAAKLLEAEGIRATVLRLLQVDVLPMADIRSLLPENAPLFVFEEVAGECGICRDLAWQMRTVDPRRSVFGRDIGKRFLTHGKAGDLYRLCGLDAQSIASFVKEELS